MSQKQSLVQLEINNSISSEETNKLPSIIIESGDIKREDSGNPMEMLKKEPTGDEGMMEL